MVLYSCICISIHSGCYVLSKYVFYACMYVWDYCTGSFYIYVQVHIVWYGVCYVCLLLRVVLIGFLFSGDFSSSGAVCCLYVYPLM